LPRQCVSLRHPRWRANEGKNKKKKNLTVTEHIFIQYKTKPYFYAKLMGSKPEKLNFNMAGVF